MDTVSTFEENEYEDRARQLRAEQAEAVLAKKTAERSSSGDDSADDLGGKAKKLADKGIMEVAFWYLMAIFVEPLGAITAFFYLNIRFLLSIFGVKTGAQMTLLQKFKLVIADIFLAIFLLLLVVIGLVVYAGITCVLDSPIYAIFSYFTNDWSYCLS